MSNNPNHQSLLINNKSSIARYAAVAAIAGAVLLAGHYGLRLLGRRHFAGAAERVTGVGGRGLPLPPGARETGRLPGNGGVIIRYTVQLEADEVAAFYREQMPRCGWRATPSPRDAELPGIRVLSYSNSGGELCTIGISAAAAGGTSLNLIVLPGARRREAG